MKKWEQFIKEMSVFQDNQDARSKIDEMIAYLSHFESKHIEDSKDKLLELKSAIDNILTGV